MNFYEGHNFSIIKCYCNIFKDSINRLSYHILMFCQCFHSAQWKRGLFLGNSIWSSGGSGMGRVNEMGRDKNCGGLGA